MLTISSSRINKRETILSIGYTNDFEENKAFVKCLTNGCNIKMKKKEKVWNSKRHKESKVN